MSERDDQGEWIAILQDDIFRPEFDTDTSLHKAPHHPVTDEDYLDEFEALFMESSIGGVVHTSLDALSERWGDPPGDVVETLSLAGGTNWLDVLIRWSDGAVRITRLSFGPTWGAFGEERFPDA